MCATGGEWTILCVCVCVCGWGVKHKKSKLKHCPSTCGYECVYLCLYLFEYLSVNMASYIHLFIVSCYTISGAVSDGCTLQCTMQYDDILSKFYVCAKASFSLKMNTHINEKTFRINSTIEPTSNQEFECYAFVIL